MAQQPIRRSRQTELGAGSLSVVLMATIVGWGALAPMHPSQMVGSEAIALSPAVVEAAASHSARGIFFATTIKAVLPTSVVLASTPDGTGALCTDDEAMITFVKAEQRQEWMHLFASADRRVIGCLPPQQVQLAAGAGAYEINVTLVDRFAPRYHSRPYFLVFVPEATGESPTPISVREGAVPTPLLVTPSSQPTVSPHRSTDVPTIPTKAGLPTATLHDHIRSEGRALPILTNGQTMAVYSITACAVFVALLVLLRMRRRRSQTQGMNGIVDLFDRETGEGCTLLLYRFPVGAGIARYPLRATALSPNIEDGLVAQIMPGVKRPQLREGGADTAHALHVGERLLVGGAIEVEYRQA